MTFDIHDEINRVNRAHALILGYPVPPPRFAIPSFLRRGSSAVPDLTRKAGGYGMLPKRRLFCGVFEPDDERTDSPTRGQAKEINRD